MSKFDGATMWKRVQKDCLVSKFLTLTHVRGTLWIIDSSCGVYENSVECLLIFLGFAFPTSRGRHNELAWGLHERQLGCGD